MEIPILPSVNHAVSDRLSVPCCMGLFSNNAKVWVHDNIYGQPVEVYTSLSSIVVVTNSTSHYTAGVTTWTACAAYCFERASEHGRSDEMTVT
jgi:hypothetical protein